MIITVRYSYIYHEIRGLAVVSEIPLKLHLNNPANKVHFTDFMKILDSLKLSTSFVEYCFTVMSYFEITDVFRNNILRHSEITFTPT